MGFVSGNIAQSQLLLETIFFLVQLFTHAQQGPRRRLGIEQFCLLAVVLVEFPQLRLLLSERLKVGVLLLGLKGWGLVCAVSGFRRVGWQRSVKGGWWLTVYCEWVGTLEGVCEGCY